MKIFFYALREFDELGFAKKFSEETGIEFGYTTEHDAVRYVGTDGGAVCRDRREVSSLPFDRL